MRAIGEQERPARHSKRRKGEPSQTGRLFHLDAYGRIGGLKRRLRPRGAASRDAKEGKQDEENANCSEIVAHRSPVRVSQLAARKRSDYATILTKIIRPSPASGLRRCS